MRKITIMCTGLMLTTLVNAAPLDLFNDTLYHDSGDGIVATPNWNNEGTWINWNITSMAPDLWRYEYVFHTDGADISHITLELTIGAVAADFSNWEYMYSDVEAEDPTFGWFSPDDGNSNPGMPESIYGVKLNLVADSPVFGFSFDTWRSPVWGDFYAKDGRQGDRNGPDRGFTYAYNAGFAMEDANDGYHIAVPNGHAVSDPGTTASLLALAMAGIGAFRRRLMMGI